MTTAADLKSARLARAASLPALADRINGLAKQEHDARLEFCKALAEARERVPRETNMTFVRWARQYLRKPDGTPWATWTLYQYASYGAHPERLTKSRASIAKSGRQAREIARMHRVRTNNVADEVNFLMTAWEQASEPARKQFLKMIGKDRWAEMK